MSCDNQFKSELGLELIDYEPATLIVGTFHPEWPTDDPAAWFFGRTANSYFWDILPRLYGEDTLIHASAPEWKQFCRDKRIAVTDIISSIDDAEPGNLKHQKMLAGFSDKAIMHNFDDFSFVNIAQLLKTRPTIRNVYLTRGVTEAFWRHLWNPVMQYCSQHGLHERKLLPPANEALYQHTVYNEEHPEHQIPLNDYYLKSWEREWRF